MTIGDMRRQLADWLFWCRCRRAAKVKIAQRLQWLTIPDEERRRWIDSIRRIRAAGISASTAAANIRVRLAGQNDAAQ